MRRFAVAALLVVSGVHCAGGGSAGSPRDGELRASGRDVGLKVTVAAGAGEVPTTAGRRALHDLVLRNEGEGDVTVESATPQGGSAISGDALWSRLVPRRRAADRPSRAILAPGTSAVLALDAAASPDGVRWMLRVRGRNEHGFDVAAAESVVVPPDARPPVVVGPPLAGAGWVAENGPCVISGHRRAVIWAQRRPCCAQRFALDFFRAGPDGRTSSGDGRRNEDHHAYGATVIACADAVVAAAVDGVPENEPDVTARAVEMSHATVAGNHVVLDLGNGAFAMYAHLRNGSVAVKAGDRVVRGATIGALGNSGNATEPHLHFHVADGPSPVEAEGLPWVFDAFVAETGPAPGQRSAELPSEGVVVSFPVTPKSATSGLPSADTSR